MTRYLSKEPMFFGPPRIVIDETNWGKNSDLDASTKCDHQGKKHIFNGEVWHCECGERL